MHVVHECAPASAAERRAPRAPWRDASSSRRISITTFFRAQMRASCLLVLCATLLWHAHAAVSITFEPPSLIGDYGVYADNGFVVSSGSPPVLLLQAAPRETASSYASSADGGRTWAPVTGTCAASLPGGSISGTPVRLPAAGGLRNFGDFPAHPIPAGGSFSTPSATHFAAAGNLVTCDELNVTTTFSGIPAAMACTDSFGGCPIRVGGSDTLVLPGGDLLLSAIVALGGNGKYATSIIAMRSTDAGRSWQYLSTIAAAAATPASEEGPNENALSLLSDGKTIACVLRLDAGDGMETHPYKNYAVAQSTDLGRTWSAAVELATAGCARPKLLHLGADGRGGVSPAPLLLSGGRWRNHDTSDILLWVDESGTLAAGPEAFGTMTSISYNHNELVANASWRFTPLVNSSKVRETTSYTSLLPLDGGPGASAGARSRRLAITYNRHLTDGSSSDMTFSMPFTITW